MDVSGRECSQRVHALPRGPRQEESDAQQRPDNPNVREDAPLMRSADEHDGPHIGLAMEEQRALQHALRLGIELARHFPRCGGEK